MMEVDVRPSAMELRRQAHERMREENARQLNQVMTNPALGTETILNIIPFRFTVDMFQIYPFQFYPFLSQFYVFSPVFQLFFIVHCFSGF